MEQPKGKEPKGTARRDHLREAEQKIEDLWEKEHVGEENACVTKQPKFMVTFPFPYMNGTLHLGHAFTLTKADFEVRYQKLKGKKALFPFAFHCTGMPIQSAANKLKRELASGKIHSEVIPEAPEAVQEAPKEEVEKEIGKFKGKKTKLVAKTGGMTQYELLEKMGIPEAEIPKFQDPVHWLHYFSPLGIEDLKQLGVYVDWRRSFITTSENPFYDQFVKWQFLHLKEAGKIGFGKRPSVYSIIDGQVCADHDRASGEGVNPQEYTLIKIKVIPPYPAQLSKLDGKEVYLVAATLRPETMYGQTNCFVLPTGEYGAFEMKNGEIFICSERSMKNMSYQDLTKERGVYNKIMDIKGMDLMGLPLSAPNAQYEKVYVLPLLTIKMDKGTGVVTSVPSDAPDDYAALRDLKQKKQLREKYNITDEMVEGYDIVEIIEIPGYGSRSAEKVCDELNIKSQNDREKLVEAKEKVYTKGFYEGIMLIGSQKGKKVCDAKPIVREEMIKENKACPYWEPEKEVISRSGDECVVAFVDQWYLDYGNEEWKKPILEYIKSNDFRAYNPAVLKQFELTLDWLKQWACSRSFGLGTLLPWDKQFVIESLSDSTIYMAYYTVAHLLQGGNIFGSSEGPLEIKAEQLTPEVFDYIFLRKEYPKECGISEDKLNELRKEFEFWYPFDLRISGKDLIKNHLTMCLYNHQAIWNNCDSDDSNKYMPRGFFCNGFLMVDQEKMSKSKGNFYSIKDCIELWGADATRFGCADAGDSMDNSNFVIDTANNAILRLTTEEDFMKSIVNNEIPLDDKRDPNVSFQDRFFLNEMKRCIKITDKAYDEMRMRDALQTGFYDMISVKDYYRDSCSKNGINMSKELIYKWMEYELIIISPIIPHWCDNIWRFILNKPETIVNADWPSVDDGDYDHTLYRAGTYLKKVMKQFRDTANKPPKKKDTPRPNKCYIYTAKHYPEWQSKILTFLNSKWNEEINDLPADIIDQAKKYITSDEVTKKMAKQAMPFAAFVVKNDVKGQGRDALNLETPFDEFTVLSENINYIQKDCGLVEVKIFHSDDESAPDPGKKKDTAIPAKPVPYFFIE